jgi:hypothetical protein
MVGRGGRAMNPSTELARMSALLPSASLKLDGHRAHVGDTIVHVGVPAGIGEPDEGRHRLTGEMRRPSDAGRLRRSAKRSGTHESLRVDGTEAGMWAGQRPHGVDEVTDDGVRCGRCGHVRAFLGCATERSGRPGAPARYERDRPQMHPHQHQQRTDRPPTPTP